MASKRISPTLPMACALGLLALGLGAGELPDPGAPGLDASERLEALVACSAVERARLRSLEARFVQRKESALLLEPETSSGTVVYLAPDRVRWDYAQPAPRTVVVRDGEVLTWSEGGGVERLAGGRRAERMLRLLGPGASLEELQQLFTMTVTFPEAAGEPYRLELEPRSSRLARRIERVTLRLDPELFVPVYLRIVEAGGDVTELSFDGLRPGAEVPEERFELAAASAGERRGAPD